VCEWVFDTTHNKRAAEIADWLVARPFHIVLILVVAYITNRIVRRSIRRLVERVTAQRDAELRDDARDGDRQWLERLRERNERSRQRALTMGAVMNSVATVVIYVIALLLCLGELGVELGPLIAGAGIAGIAIGFGTQSLVRDFVSGMFIVIEDQYGVGDTVDLGDASGTVEKVTLRTTWLRDLDGTLWVVPNGEIRRVANKSQRWARAVVDVRVAAEADLDQAVTVIRRTAAELFESQRGGRPMLEAPQVLGVESFAEGAATVRVTVKTEPGAQFNVGRLLRTRLKAAFDQAGIPGFASAPQQGKK
jgi:small conductance mechanosensitive channel